MSKAISGERLYTRNGIFKLNSDAELVNATGQRLLGYGVDDQFRLQGNSATRTTAAVPLGTESVAKATENVTFEGTLTPEGELSTVSQVIESVQLGDAQVPQPDASGVSDQRSAPLSDANNITVTIPASDTVAAGTYQYRVALVDSAGNESTPSSSLSATVGGGGQVDLSNLPADGTRATTRPSMSIGPHPTGTDFFLARLGRGRRRILRRRHRSPVRDRARRYDT